MSWEDREIYCLRPMIKLNDPEPNHVLGRLKLSGVKIELDEQSLMPVIESFLNQYLPCFWASVIADIAMAIKEELAKSRNEIDADLVNEVVEYLKKQGKKKEGPGDEWSDEEEEPKEEESESSSDSDSEEEDDDHDDDDEAEAAKVEEVDDLKDPTIRKKCIDDLLFLAGRIGMSVKPGDEEEILDLMIPHIRGSISYLLAIKIFLKRVREHINRCSVLDSLETVETALKSDIFDQEDYEDYKVQKNLVPTKEEGIATSMNQITPEEVNRDSGDLMEIQESETSMIPLNLPKQPKESLGNAYSCVRESLERAGGNKRKLAQV